MTSKRNKSLNQEKETLIQPINTPEEQVVVDFNDENEDEKLIEKVLDNFENLHHNPSLKSNEEEKLQDHSIHESFRFSNNDLEPSKPEVSFSTLNMLKIENR